MCERGASAAVPDAAVPALAPSAALLADLVAANHVLADRGIVDAFGHVSARHDADPRRFLLARNMAPALVQEEDILSFDERGQPLDAQGRRVYLERFLHAAIYRARPDVQAIVHSHAHALLPLGLVAGVRLRALFHMAGFIGTGAPVFEIRDVAGTGSDLLVRDLATGDALARCLGAGHVVLMRGHGATVTGAGLRQAVFRAVHAEANARIQTAAMGLGGDITYLGEAEAEACRSTHEAQADRAWDLWAAQAAARRLHPQQGR